MANVTIIGAGHWGIALASVVAANGYNVLVYARKEEAAKAINNGYSNYFKNIKLNKNIKATSIIDEAVSFSNCSCNPGCDNLFFYEFYYSK